MLNIPDTIITKEGYAVTVDMSLTVALICKGFEIKDCQPLDEDEFPGVYVYTFSSDEKIQGVIDDFDAGKLLIEPGEYWETMVTIHEEHHAGARL